MTSSQELEDGELQENSPLPFTLIEQQPTYNPLVDTATHKFAVPPYYLQRTNHIKDTNQEQPKRIRENQHGLPEESVGSAQQVGFVTEWNPRPVDLQETQERQYEKYVDSYQVIQVISSLIAQGFPVPSDWLQNPQIYQWLVEWIKQSTQKPFLNSLSTEQSQLSGDNSFNVVTTPPFNRSIQKNAKERNPPQRVSSPGTFIKTRKGKMRNFKSMPQKHNNSSKNMKYHRKQQRNEVHENINSSHEETTCKESNLRVQNDTKYSMIEQQKELNETSQEQKKNPLSVEQLRIQAKMSLKRKASIENKDIEKTACHQDDNIENERDKPSLKVKESTLSNSNHPENHSSSLVITVESSSSSSSSNNASTEQVQNKNNQKNALVSGTSQSKWSTLEELRRRVQELEQRKKQYLQRGISWTKDKRPKITDSNTQKQGNIADSLDDKSKASHYWQTFAPSQPQLSSLEAQGTEEKQSGSKGNHSSTMKRLSSPKHVSFDDSDTDETKAWIERLEREACKAWDEHDKSITEEIEARNKLIRIRTCEEAARESTKLLRELLKKSRLDIQQYESQSRSIERQIEQIEARRKLALAMAEKNQRKLERLRRLVAMESLISKETEPLLLLLPSNKTNSNIHSKEIDSSNTCMPKSFPELWSPSPWTTGALRPLMSTFRCYPLLHFVHDYSQLLTWYNELHWETELCRYELHGSCSDPDCKFQHWTGYASIKYLFKKLEKSFSTLFWLRHGTSPNEKLLQLFHSQLESLSTTVSFSSKESTIHWFQGPVQKVVCELLNKKNMSSLDDIYHTALFIPLKEENDHDDIDLSLSHQSILSMVGLGEEEKEPFKVIDSLVTQAKSLYDNKQIQQAMETLARGLERFPYSSLLWEFYFTLFITHSCTKNRETLLEQANRYCPDRQWDEWIMHQMEQSSQSNKGSRYYDSHGI